MDLAVVCVGDELLDGRIRDRNASRLGGFLEGAGHRLVSAQIVPDEADTIVQVLDEAARRAPFVVVSGGLGPTRDDRTRHAAARWAEVELELREPLLERLRKRFDEAGFTFTENNRRQCYVPEGAEVLPSEVGTASSFVLERDSTEAWFLPGVPREFDWYVEQRLLERLDGAESEHTASTTLTFLGLGESGLETRLAPAIELADRHDLAVSYLADAPTVEVRLRGHDGSAVDAVRSAILDEIGDWLVTDAGESLAARAGRRLQEEGATVAAAESCTAGWISKELTDISGSSGWFEYGFVAYANRAKIDLLDVDPASIERHGAVSPEVVRQMASGARARASADFGLAVSGIAGPSGGTDEKPVGTVDFGLATPEGVYTRRIQFPPRSRRSVRWSTVQTALGLLLWYLDGRLEAHSVDGPVSDDSAPSG